jgi:RNA polymerase sigma-70 factor (ECF subfamily)
MADRTSIPAHRAIDTVIREEWGRVLATLVGLVRDFTLAEDALQDAVVIAVDTWDARGVPENPRAWLVQTARHKAIDRLRRATRFEAKRAEIKVLADLDAATHTEPAEDDDIPDERLRLIFTCCHPALADDARVALTLRTLGGLTTGEIARAFLVPETTMAQRLVRAQRKIKAAGIPYRVPPPELWAERLDSVLTVLYLIFNEGYAATSGEAATRADLCQEALRLTENLVALAPDAPEIRGLLALMLFHEARRPARTDSAGVIVPLEDQNRSLWNIEQIARGDAILQEALVKSAPCPGRYQLQAAISGLHATAPTFEATDWEEILMLYGRLHQLQPSAIIRLNAVAAASFRYRPEAALKSLADLVHETDLETYQPYHATHADLLRRAGRLHEAAEAYRTAIAASDNSAERRFLEARLATMTQAA